MSPVGVTRLQNIRDPVVNLSGRKLEISHDTIVVDFQANDGKPDGLPDDVRLGGTFPSSQGRQPDDLVSVQIDAGPTFRGSAGREPTARSMPPDELVRQLCYVLTHDDGGLAGSA